MPREIRDVRCAATAAAAFNDHGQAPSKQHHASP
jgi:hypothetical protein